MNYENNVLKRELHELSSSCAIPVLENSLSMIFDHLEERCKERLLGEKSSKVRGLQAHTRRLITPWHSVVYVSSNAGQQIYLALAVPHSTVRSLAASWKVQ